ncbi:hypothetical protein C8R43DRAFT_1133522 [Mycena crocata]|nr:hypothetical protein C8R43DRAFT_1133522 [Mycena crocata]
MSIQMPVNLLANKSDIPLGAFDGRVGAIFTFGIQEYFATTNTDFVPTLPVLPDPPHLLPRVDMRFGTEDPVLYPQFFTTHFPHLACIPNPAGRHDLAMMYCDLSPADFEAESIYMRNLGKMKWCKLSPIIQLASPLVKRYQKWKAAQAQARSTAVPLADHLAQCMIMVIERLQTLPSTREKAQYDLTSVQRSFLELTALLDYFSIFKPRMDDLNLERTTPPSEELSARMGAFTSHPQHARWMHTAGLPFWFVRETHMFTTENIREQVEVREPPRNLLQQLAPDHGSVYTGRNLTERFQAIHRAMVSITWYQDPYELGQPVNLVGATLSDRSSKRSQRPTEAESTASAVQLADSTPSEARSSSPREANSTTTAPFVRYKPYLPTAERHQPEAANSGGRRGASQGIRGNRRGPQPLQSFAVTAAGSGRDKFEPFQHDAMASWIPVWAEALQRVDRKVPTRSVQPHDRSYLFPEPAIFVNTRKMDLFVHHWMMLSVVFEWRMRHAPVEDWLLSGQQWRDILEGKLEERGKPGRTQRRSAKLAPLIEPALRTCNINDLDAFPVKDPPAASIDQVKQLTWRLAEMNFRFELLSLDNRASGSLHRSECQQCFAGGLMMGFPLEVSQQGLASDSRPERHRYFVRLATLMLDWNSTARRPAALQRGLIERRDWTDAQMRDLEEAVAGYYTQCFFEFFGRAPVLPMRLDDYRVEEEGEIV